MMKANLRRWLQYFCLLWQFGSSQAYIEGFSCSAALDPSTGRASSLEQSVFQVDRTESLRDQRAKLKSVFHNKVAGYPQWISQGDVSLGFLTSQNNDDTKMTALKSRLGKFNLLTFGQAETTSVTEGSCTIELKVEGGLLSLPPMSGTDRGCLEFTLLTTVSDEDEKKLSVEILTRIKDSYCPTLAGRPPVRRHRNMLYRSTQSLTHAYVMWRFHRTATKSLIGAS